MLRFVNGRYFDGEKEITKEEYDALRGVIFEKKRWVNAVFSGEALLDDVPEEWREEIASRVERRREEDAQPKELEPDEALEIILGGGEA